METKDYVLVFGVAATLFLGIWNLIQTHRSTRKTSFINTVTSQRIQWIEQLRQDVAAFCGCTHTWYTSNLEHKPQGVEMLTEVDRLRYLIRLRLNPNDTYDRKVAAILKRIPELTHSSRPAELLTALEELTAATQLLIKEEWEKVKWEAKNGDLVEMKRLIE